MRLPDPRDELSTVSTSPVGLPAVTEIPREYKGGGGGGCRYIYLIRGAI